MSSLIFAIASAEAKETAVHAAVGSLTFLRCAVTRETFVNLVKLYFTAAFIIVVVIWSDPTTTDTDVQQAKPAYLESAAIARNVASPR